MKMEHTPAPWFYEQEDGCCGQILSRRGVVAEFIEEPAEYNLRLIVAAPDLLSACKAMLRYQEMVESDDRTGLISAYAVAFESAEEAVKKSTGGTK
jgi:hypothetical protein